MTPPTRILGVVVAVLAAAVLLLALNHNSACESPGPPAAQRTAMNAIIHRCYGGPEIFELEEVAK